MEKFKSFSDIAQEKGVVAEPLDTSFLDDFNAFMRESVRQSDKNSMAAAGTASMVFINR
jgi:hypothetical protein